MNNCIKILPRRADRLLIMMRYFSKSRDSDSGAGGAGSIREAGGSFAKRESAQEDQFFYNQQKEQLAKLKNSLNDEISFHEEQIQRHKEAIERNKKRVEDLSKTK